MGLARAGEGGRVPVRAEGACMPVHGEKFRVAANARPHAVDSLRSLAMLQTRDVRDLC